MKRNFSDCLESLPSPEYSEPEYQVLSSPKKTRVITRSHEFIDGLEGSMLDFVNKDGSITKKRLNLDYNHPKHLVVVFFGVINEFLDPINKSYEKLTKVFNSEVIAISSNVSKNNYAFPLINGSKISKKFNVLDPMGGGVYPRDVIMIFDKEGNKRVEIPVTLYNNYLLDKPIVEVLMDYLEELESEVMTL
ncbi:hypothetical protein BN7_616 [Wickerhamomyces ciferrii]|uniref:Uncharacterized protein n=1 Tax=Wickerhamomyces ciferrii (strain ATCC 14091 / BCRC 22168 / CBS 111 / JCM 3599 / NBRC 0793 / NRRL Y-1031 F-60-10) TaxID=1206466 RepID=K0KI45_WICCF|nr:uncharacterized protein BN7_616 [Wickerhamomyces ciferrii]CCH41079.1 hypothetical protein BN7_616 [Wickerhamomyces ciferrii]